MFRKYFRDNAEPFIGYPPKRDMESAEHTLEHWDLFQTYLKLYEDTLNLTAGFHGIDVPVTSKRAYSLMDLDRETGFLSLLTETGDCKEDVGLTRSPLADQPGGEPFDEVGMAISRRFDEGDALRVVVLSVMGKELVVGAEADNDA